MIALEPAIDLFGRPKGFDTKVGLYFVLLGDIPPDLLVRGVFAALRDTAFFPWPAEIRAPIREELSRRNDTAQRLGAALMLAEKAQQRP